MTARPTARAAVAVLAGALLLAGCTTAAEQDAAGEGPARSEGVAEGTIAFLVPNQTVVRWTRYDEPNMKAALAELAPKMTLETSQADDEATRQLQQAEAAISRGAKAIVMAAVDPEQTAAITTKAEAAGIPVIAYAHEANGSDPDYYVTVPFEEIGEQAAQYLADNQEFPTDGPLRLAKVSGDPKFFFYTQQAKGQAKVLDPLVAEGKVEIVCDADSTAYATEAAQQAMDQCLTATGDDVDAVLVTNDSTANGVIASLAGRGLAGQVKVYGGYDAEAATMQQLLAGNLETDMRPPYQEMARAAMELAVNSITGKPVDGIVNGEYDNKKISVPTVYAENVFITRDNVDASVVEPGVLTQEELCGGPATSSPFCAG